MKYNRHEVKNNACRHTSNKQFKVIKRQQFIVPVARIHTVFQCNRFKNMSLTERRNLAYSWKLCFNILGDGHMTRDCSSKSTCKKRQKNNTLLYPEKADTRKTVPIDQNTALHQSTPQFDSGSSDCKNSSYSIQWFHF